jgi:Flp pilus assembly protein TadD
MLTVGTMLSDSVRTRAAGLVALQVASEAYPRSVAILVRLSDAYLASGNRAAAIDAIRRASEIAPEDPTVAQKRAALGAR